MLWPRARSRRWLRRLRNYETDVSELVSSGCFGRTGDCLMRMRCSGSYKEIYHHTGPTFRAEQPWDGWTVAYAGQTNERTPFTQNVDNPPSNGIGKHCKGAKKLCRPTVCSAHFPKIKSLGSDVIRRLSAAWCGTTSRRKNTVLEEPQPTPIGPVYCPPVS